MKKILFLLVTCLLTILEPVRGQQAPAWTQSISAFPDTAYVMPVRVLTDAASNIYVLSRYSKNVSPGLNVSKVFLHKYHPDSTLEWSFVYDSSSRGQPLVYDMVLDDSGNCYLAGTFYNPSSIQPMLLMKVTTAGTFAWLRDSCSVFHYSNLDQVIHHHGRIYTKGYSGMVVFDTLGNELWSPGYSIQSMAVDHSGNTILTANVGANLNLFKLDTGGNVLFNDSALYAGRIAVDSDNSFYLMTDFPQYELAKYDSAGNFQWNRTNFPVPPPFGDIYYNVLVDYNDEVLAIGLADTMYKFTTSGALIWQRPMNGLDSYTSAAQIVYSNFLAIAGTVPDSNGYNMEIRLYDLIGNVTWTGFYNGSALGQEYTVDLAVDGSGIYGLETTGDNTTLVKFDSPFFLPPDYSLVCVDSVWYDALDTNLIHVRLFNGNLSHLNYPSVRIVSPLGDTIGNPSNFVNFFAHLGNIYLEYVDTITEAGITDFSTYTFVIMEGFGDTAAVIGWCFPLGLEEPEKTWVRLYPNPAEDWLAFEWKGSPRPFTAEIMSHTGAVVRRVKLSGTENKLDLSGLASGFYMLRIIHEKGVLRAKFLKAGD